MILAPADAPPGSMADLKRFFDEETNIRAIPGYHGPNRNHVLRLSGLPETDTAFLHLLQEDFTRWQKQQHGRLPGIALPDHLRCEPIDEVDHFPHQSAWKRALKENANMLTGLAYMSGSVGLLLAAWRQPRRMPGKPNHDLLRSYTAGAYFTAAAILVAMSRSADNPRHTLDILETIYPRLAQADDATRQQAAEETSSIIGFLEKYPWETSMILNATGAGTHALSCLKRRDYVEFAGSVGTMTGCFLSSVIPEKGGRSLIPLGEWLEGKDGSSLYERIERFAHAHPDTAGWMTSVNRAYDWLEENPLRAASAPQVMANLSYAAAGIRAQNYPLTAMSAAYLAGNYTQSQASKGRGDSFDSVVTSAANIIAADPQLNRQDKDALRRKVRHLAKKLAQQKDVVHTEARMEKGILARLQRELNPQADAMESFLPSERGVISQSPFVEDTHLQRVLAGDASASAGIS
jgi:hypothetical protein